MFDDKKTDPEQAFSLVIVQQIEPVSSQCARGLRGCCCCSFSTRRFPPQPFDDFVKEKQNLLVLTSGKVGGECLCSAVPYAQLLVGQHLVHHGSEPARHEIWQSRSNKVGPKFQPECSVSRLRWQFAAAAAAAAAACCCCCRCANVVAINVDS